MIIKPFIALQTHYCSGSQSHQYLMSDPYHSWQRDLMNSSMLKLQKSRTGPKPIQKTQNPNIFIEDGYLTELRIGTLTPVSYMEVINMVKSIPPKSCDLDPIPTKILKNHIDALAQGIANIINTSFEQGYVCDSLKEAIIRPLMKSPKLNLVFPNFRTRL